MEITNIWEWLIQQTPALVVMGIVLFFGFRYMKTQIADKQQIINDKDEELKQLNRDYREDLQKSFNSLQDVNSAVNQSLQKWIMKDEQNFDLKKAIQESLNRIERVCDSFVSKLDSK